MAMRLWIPGLLLFALTLNQTSAARAQGTSGPRVSDSSAGYIDNAIPGDDVRFRFDAAYDFTRATRAEFFYPVAQPLGHGLPRPEPRVDYQDLSAYLELAPSERFSGFVELPWRFLNPEVNADTNGFADMNAGFKYAFVYRPDLVATFQFRTYAPTGDSRRGLGNDHVSLEPAILLYAPLTERLVLNGEFRYWVPIGGTDFAGDLVRYGLGLQYDLSHSCRYRITPVAEVIGWTVLSGKESFVTPSGEVGIADAAGDTIVNLKLGARIGLGERSDVYAGYGRSLTGDRWYENTFRLEYRLLF
jgi:hypothetical protein